MFLLLLNFRLPMFEFIFLRMQLRDDALNVLKQISHFFFIFGT